MADAVLGTIRTWIPARLDRLPWSRFHWRVVVGLGTVWILDGLEVTIVGAMGARLTESGSGVGLTTSGIGTAAAIYVAGACVGALFFGQLTDRFGRKRLMMITLGIYILATVTTAFSFAPWFFYLCRFFTGTGIGGEYAAINSAIDELIPARNRGQVDITINGSYWVGSAVGGLAALLFLNNFATDFGWRLAFGVGAIIGLSILLVRRQIPESPRWLFIHGREAEAERIVDGIEAEVRAETHQELAPPRESITVRQRAAIPFREIARVAFRFYPKRAVLGLALFVGQAFLYNAVTFSLGNMLSNFFGVASGTVPVYTLIFAIGNFSGAFLLGRLFDTVGRRPMISVTYLGSAALTVLLGVLMLGGGLTSWSFIALVGITFFFASAGASSAYLTVSEIFPMETRALAIAFFYAVGTGLGGIIGPLLFGHLIDHGQSVVAVGFFIGAFMMALGGVAELLFGVRAERLPLENIAKPVTVADAEAAASPAAAPSVPDAAAPAPTEPTPVELRPEHREALQARQRAEEERARAAEHRAAVHDLRANGGNGDPDRLRAEQVLAEMAELRAQGFDEQATGHEERSAADDGGKDADRQAALERAQAADERAQVDFERAEALSAEHRTDADRHNELAEAASERARAREQGALADDARGKAEQAEDAEATVFTAEAEMYDAWTRMHEAHALAHAARAEGTPDDAAAHDREADVEEERALAAKERVDAAQHRVAAIAAAHEEGSLERTAAERERAESRERAARERDERIRQRLARQESRERTGLRRFLPGPGNTLFSPGMVGTASRWAPSAQEDLDREISAIARALDARGATNRDDLAEAVGARYWGPGRFRAALREALYEGSARRVARDVYGPGD